MTKLDQLKALGDAKRATRKSTVPVLAAEPAISPTVHGGKAVGRTAGSNPATGAKRGRPRIGEQRDKPWIAAGMSERTWYRRQSEAKKIAVTRK